MLGALAYALGSVHSIMGIKEISFITKLISLCVMLLISQIYTDFYKKGISVKNIFYYLGMFSMTAVTIMIYNNVVMRMFKF